VEAGALQAPAGLSRISISAPLLRLRSDEQLVALFRAGNEEAFQVIFDRYRQRLFAYTRQMLSGSRQDAEDALQDVFLRAYGALRASDRPVSLRAWLYRVAHNRCIDQLRRPTPAQADVFDVSRSPLRDPLAETERREDLRRLVEDVQRLPEAQRSALLMREIDGLSYQELADALDVTVPAIKSLLVRARIGLVEAIEARDTACSDIRNDLLASFDKGVRASGKARRHLRDCSGCRAYRTELRTVQRGLGALSPGHSGPLSVIAKLFGIGGAGGGAAVGGGAVAGGGAIVAGGGATAATACKVAALVCSAALVTGAAQEAVRHERVGPAPAAGARPHTAAVAPQQAAFHLASAARAAAVAPPHGLRRAGDGTAQPSAAVAAADEGPITPDGDVYSDPPGARERQVPAMNETGGAMAPVEDPNVAGEAPAVTVPSAPPGAATTPIAPPTGTAAAATTPGSTPATATTGAGTASTTGAGTTTGAAPSPTAVGGTSAAPATATGTPPAAAAGRP
jgi:RNA polymerase sigma factor (sigma-70 family)